MHISTYPGPPNLCRSSISELPVSDEFLPTPGRSVSLDLQPPPSSSWGPIPSLDPPWCSPQSRQQGPQEFPWYPTQILQCVVWVSINQIISIRTSKTLPYSHSVVSFFSKQTHRTLASLWSLSCTLCYPLHLQKLQHENCRMKQNI